MFCVFGDFRRDSGYPCHACIKFPWDLLQEMSYDIVFFVSMEMVLLPLQNLDLREIKR